MRRSPAPVRERREQGRRVVVGVLQAVHREQQRRLLRQPFEPARAARAGCAGAARADRRRCGPGARARGAAGAGARRPRQEARELGVVLHRGARLLRLRSEQLVDELLGDAVGAAVRGGVDDHGGRAEQARFEREIVQTVRALPMPGLGRDHHRRALCRRARTCSACAAGRARARGRRCGRPAGS